MRVLVSASVLVLLLSCTSSDEKQEKRSLLTLEQDASAGTISIFRSGERSPLLVQHAERDIRPYIHPIVAPDGKGELTQFSPEHHKHQTGLYWGLKELNGRDYFMNWKGDYWRRISAEILTGKGDAVKWRTVYELMDESGNAVLTETQTWSFTERNRKYNLDLLWEGKANKDITVGKFYVGGLFVRMPWQEGVNGMVVNSDGQRNADAEGQRALWNDVGIQVPNRTDMGHIAMLDHPDNKGFPVAWRVDSQLGVGPSRQILGEWSLTQGEQETFRYRILVYTGNTDKELVQRTWKEFACQSDK